MPQGRDQERNAGLYLARGNSANGTTLNDPVSWYSTAAGTTPACRS